MMSIYDYFSDKEQNILRTRAERAARVQEAGLENVLELLAVSIGGERYALPMADLAAAYQGEINLAASIIPIPCTPAFVAGVVNLRGHVIPVIDLAVLLGLPQDVSSETVAFVLVSDKDMTLAFRIESIGDVLTVPESNLASVDQLVNLPRTDYLHGSLPDGTVVIAITTILHDPALTVDEVVS